MIKTYSDYIDRYMREPGLNGAKSPGEHHFVATYLMPRLLKVRPDVPDYVNPDGTKKMCGDIVYFDDGKHRLGIEVKFDTIRLTVNEFNSWIINGRGRHPDYFLGIGKNGMLFVPWRDFRRQYRDAVDSKKLVRISKGYGPMKQVNVLLLEGEIGHYQRATSANAARIREREFVEQLREAINV